MNNNNQLILEYHLYDTVQLIKTNKYKKFINLSRKLVCHPYLINDAFYIQLHIQLIRRLLYCQLKVIKKYFFNFSTKQQTILEVLLTCMSYCQNYLILLNKFQATLHENQEQENRVSRKVKFFNELNKLTIKQFAVIFDKLEPDQKSTKWLQYQYEELFCFIQKTLLFNYFYCKYSLLKEATLFLNKLIKLKPLKTFSSQYQYLLGLSLKNSAQFELNFSSNPESIEYGFSILQASLKEYHKPKSNLILLQKQLIKLSSIISLNLDLQSKSQELSDLHHDCIQSLNLAHFIVQQTLLPLKVKVELTDYIESEYEFISEKFEQIMLEEQDLTLFTQFLFGYHNEKQKVTKLVGNSKLQEMIKAKLQENSQISQATFQKGFRSIKSDQFVYNSSQDEKLTLQEYLPIKIKSYHKNNTTTLSNPATSTTITLTTTNMNNFMKDSPQTKRERSNYNPNLTSFVSQNTMSVNQIKMNTQQQYKQKKRQISVKCKRLNTNSDHKSSYLSQLINLRQKSSLTVKEELSELEKNHLALVEQLQKWQRPVKIGTIDEFFNKKIEAIAFEECLTLDQIKDTAKKIITTEWEIHKEMPVTKSLMKSISVSDIQQLQIKSDYNKLQEYREIQNQDYYNTQKDQARVEINHTKEVKKLKINQQKFSMQQHRGSQPNILNSQKLQQLTAQENKVQEQLISQLQLQQQQQQQQNTTEVKVSPRIARKNASLLYSSHLEDDNKEKGFALVKGQLIDLMLKNLEYRDELQKQEQLILPRQFRTKAISPQYGEGSLRSQNMSDFKSFAFSTNSTTITTQHLHQK